MNTPRHRPIPSTSRSASKLSTWRPKAFLRTLMSISLKPGCWESAISFAMSIIPAHVPHRGIPCLVREIIAWSSPNLCMILPIVVLSPPGIIKASACSKSFKVRTSMGSAPHRRRLSSCSRNAPWRASIPIFLPATILHPILRFNSQNVDSGHGFP